MICKRHINKTQQMCSHQVEQVSTQRCKFCKEVGLPLAGPLLRSMLPKGIDRAQTAQGLVIGQCILCMSWASRATKMKGSPITEGTHALQEQAIRLGPVAAWQDWSPASSTDASISSHPHKDFQQMRLHLFSFTNPSLFEAQQLHIKEQGGIRRDDLQTRMVMSLLLQKCVCF